MREEIREGFLEGVSAEVGPGVEQGSAREVALRAAVG